MTAVRMLLGPAAVADFVDTWATHDLNDADNAIALVFHVPKNGTLNRVGIYIAAITGNPPAYNVAFVTVSSAGAPTTTLYGGSAIESYDFTATGWVWITLATPATATKGDLVAVHIWPGATIPDGTNYISTRLTQIPYEGSGSIPRQTRYTTSWLNTYGWVSTMVARYSDGEIAAGIGLITGLYSEYIHVDTSPDEIGCAFTVPYNVTCDGARLAHENSGSATVWEVRLYDSDGSTVLRQVSVTDMDQVINYSPSLNYDAMWAPVNLVSGQTYRLTIRPTGTGVTRALALGQFTFDTTDAELLRALLPEGARWQRTERTDLGTWTQTATKAPYMGIWITDITVGGATRSEAVILD